ncbi:MAG: DUF3185 family protein [Vampirovibrionales bacterium]|nr:DUF3185 family protein [Vampirovibrionales bacterium]
MNKKWIMGCGGCLGLILVLALIIGGLSLWGFNAYQGAAKETVAELFNGKPPADYQPIFSIKLPDSKRSGESVPFSMLINKRTKTMLFAIRMALSQADLAKINSRDPKQLEAFLQEVVNSANNPNANGEVSVNRVLDLKTARGPVHAVEASASTKKGKMPALCAFLPDGGERVKVLAMVSAEGQSTNPDASFQDDFQWMGGQMTALLNEMGPSAVAATAPGVVSPAVKSTPAKPSAAAVKPAPVLPANKPKA